MGKEWHCWSWPYDLKPDDLLTLKIAKKKEKMKKNNTCHYGKNIYLC